MCFCFLVPLFCHASNPSRLTLIELVIVDIDEARLVFMEGVPLGTTCLEALDATDLAHVSTGGDRNVNKFGCSIEPASFDAAVVTGVLEFGINDAQSVHRLVVGMNSSEGFTD